MTHSISYLLAKMITLTLEKMISDGKAFQKLTRPFNVKHVVMNCHTAMSVVGIWFQSILSLYSDNGLSWRVSHFFSSDLSLMFSNNSRKSYKICKNQQCNKPNWTMSNSMNIHIIKILPTRRQQNKTSKSLSIRHHFFSAAHVE